MRTEASHHESSVNDCLTHKDLVDFGKLMNAIDGKRVQAALRTLLQYCFEYNKKLTNFNNSVNLYRVF